MHIYFSGIGGAGIGPLALIAHQAGFKVSGSDQIQNRTVEYLRQHGLTNIHIGQSYDQIASVNTDQLIDWFVYTSALAVDQPDSPEILFCAENNIKTSQRDEFLNYFLQEKHLKMVAVAGTHGKTTTTAMAIWLFKQLGLPVSYSVGAKLSFGDMGAYDPASQYFIYEADEYNRNFLAFHPCLSLITGIDWDHPDIYPTLDEYNSAFRQFLGQSQQTVIWKSDAVRLNVTVSEQLQIIDESDPEIDKLKLPGIVNRQDAWLVAKGVASLTSKPMDELLEHLNRFPGVSRRFEQIAPNIYSDYAHTPPKIRGALQLAHEVAGDNVVVVYEGLHNMRQHFIRDELATLFDSVKQLYIVPSYLAREDPNLPLLSPLDLKNMLSAEAQSHTTASKLNEELKNQIQQHVANGDLVLCLTAGGGKSLDEWLRTEFKSA
ncbi:MAG TPA: Mur ligase domain-containing protein [Patescibacteria group bacterium]|nr:Mur ligase domain-containing protein [Patescibacteria group bacterium]